MLGYVLTVSRRLLNVSSLSVIFVFLFVFLLACQSALEGRAVVNLQMGNTFGAFVDMNDAIKVHEY